MDVDQNTAGRAEGGAPHVGPPDLILQAIVAPTDAPAEIRAAVADALARKPPVDGTALSWEDVTFAASVIALVEGTTRRAEPDTQWVFALSADAPRLGEQVHSSGTWAGAIHPFSPGSAVGRVQWRISLFDAVRTEPRNSPAPPAEAP